MWWNRNWVTWYSSHRTAFTKFRTEFVLPRLVSNSLLHPECFIMTYSFTISQGGRTIKVAWNRITLNSLNNTFDYVVDRYHRLLKPEVYRTRLLVYYATTYYTKMVTMYPDAAEYSTYDALSKLLPHVRPSSDFPCPAQPSIH
jgi:hypothetical protein